MSKFTLFSIFLIIPFMLLAADIKGVVTDSNSGDPLVGANVSIQGESLGAATDADGYFVIENVSEGDKILVFNYVGYKELTKTVTVGSADLTIEVQMEAEFLLGETITVEITRAKERETPIAFSEIGKEQILDNYSTQDVPDLIRAVPGVFTSTAGLGESEIFIRGFDAEHIQVLINGIPENDPESQVVYWSNWSGLSGNASSIQVQRGVGASLVGSGAFGGSVNITTSEYSPTRQLKVRGSVVNYFNGSDKIADGTGGFQDYNPANQIFAIEYGTGLMYDGLLNVYMRYERKSGDSYLQGTYYNGHSFYLGAQSFLGDHVVTVNLHGAPQRHNQARTASDPELLETLGREYNRYAHPYQENYYFKPQFEIHDDWKISDDQFLTSRFFATTGTGGGRYLRNDRFSITTGENYYQTISTQTSWTEFGRHARWIHENTGEVLTGYNPADRIFSYGGIVDTVTRSGRMLSSSQFGHSWRNDSQNNHVQFGFNTAYQQKINDMFTITVGGEARRWDAEHTAQSFDFRYADAAGNLVIADEVQRRYNYDGIVTNLSGFARVLISPIKDFTVMLDGQYASYNSKVEEQPIDIFDFGAGRFTGTSYKATENSGDFAASDYERTYEFFQPKFGANYNVNENLNIFGNYSIAKKEPKVGDWYDRDDGPGANQIEGKELDPETLTNIELGLGYRTRTFGLQANVYMMTFEDKIEGIVNQEGDSETINAGKAEHTGFELMANGRMDNIDGFLSATYSINEWTDLSVDEIFGEDAADIEGKTVPFSPGTMLNGEVGYTMDAVRFSLGFNYWDEYYGDYINEYKLDAFTEINAAISYGFKVGTSQVDLRLNLNNITNEENLIRASFASDFGRDDFESGARAYVLPAPKFNTALTASISL